LLTEVALAVAERFGVNFDECHNDNWLLVSLLWGSQDGSLRKMAAIGLSKMII